MKETEARKARRQIQVGLLFHAGDSIAEIAKRVGCHRNTVRDDLEAMGMIDPKPPGRPRKHAAAQQETPTTGGRIETAPHGASHTNTGPDHHPSKADLKGRADMNSSPNNTSIRVTPLDDGYWQVAQHGRWWTVAKVAADNMHGWLIQNESGRRIDPGKPLGQRLVRAVQDHRYQVA
ncbi:HTH DNA binding domain protein [Gordonia phage Asapag]|uniref:HTH DNA binding domain protein n=1 Tax=Gordonia phage Asapag TaxID=2507862 RepID=A0A410TDX9_9CAUD|nr:HTH DNA binding domain protein [Gordonia phage Asapag]QAU07220.1 HTH DNA binding domain protein [Gordonia phage Asapag]